jgi:hypothetical protein
MYDVSHDPAVQSPEHPNPLRGDEDQQYSCRTCGLILDRIAQPLHRFAKKVEIIFVGWEVDTVPSKLSERRNLGFVNPQSPWKARDVVTQPLLNVPS